ncbi:PLP-dependent aminotransferase family protein [Crenobacter sp. SG2305]|uniref:aminotransferase-like domain-containing protein n=1 Tax=Crenobacter oryzisoli TaxID=3056844 RepID=UPI0025AB595A|nr:PLP-dependent aminotransferase family protein [Crenobacter sp. SG2305]MDN0083645.1 PLP-dependent aminotransferase family protein [Crenobacter sp. SG2305]
MFQLDTSLPTPLVVQIVGQLKMLIDEQKLRAGTKLPSIRSFAEAHGISVSTVIDAYDRLVAEGYLVPRQNTGFFVRSFHPRHSFGVSGNASEVQFDSLWMLHKSWENDTAEINPGCGWLPEKWMDDDSLRRNLRAVSGQAGDFLTGYGAPQGYLPLRRKIADWLHEHEIYAPPEQVLLTTGASHALGLLVQYLVKPGETVFVDEPGYSVLLFHLKRLGANVVGVPWSAQGPDLEALGALLQQHRPRVLFTNPRLQNPTGASCSAATAHKLLQLAERHDFLVVEDDIYAELDPSSRRSLASMDQLSRVVYVNSFSKTICASLRVGYIAGHPDLIGDLTQFKMMTGLTSCELTERATYQILTEGRHRKHLKMLRERLHVAQQATRQRLAEAGLELFSPHASEGMFVWARRPGHDDSAALSYEALNAGIFLAPGHLFYSDNGPSPWLRFNVGYCDDARLYDFLTRA